MTDNNSEHTDHSRASDGDDTNRDASIDASSEAPFTSRRFIEQGIFKEFLASATQLDILTAAARNPTASFSELGNALGVSTTTVRTTLRSLAHDTIGRDRGDGWTNNRNGERRSAQSVEELTKKQRAVVETLARFPNVLDVKPIPDVLEAARVLTGISMSRKHMKNISKQYEDLIDEYRTTLDESEVRPITDASDELPRSEIPINDMSPDELLDQAGIPRSNVDLDRSSDTGVLGLPEDALCARQTPLALDTDESESE